VTKKEYLYLQLRGFLLTGTAGGKKKNPTHSHSTALRPGVVGLKKSVSIREIRGYKL